MQRRDFVKLVVGCVSAWPLSVSAQQAKSWRIGFLHPGQSALVSNRIVAFREGLSGSAPKDAADAEIIVRLANEQFAKLPAMAMELVQQNVQAICAVSPPAVRAARQATKLIPIVAMDLESDPVANGWAASLAHPGGNVTGIFLDIPGFNAKSLQLLREAVPALTKVAVIWHPVSGNLQLEAVRKAAVALGVTMEMLEVSSPSDFEPAFLAAARSQSGGVLMLSSPLFGGNPQLLADLALKNRLPAINIYPDFAQKGGLIGYGPELQNLFMQSGVLVRKALLGSPIADLPVERPTRFRLVANAVTARALGLTLPTSILLSADEIIE
ncbi:ABC transporter substrate-binding protein [Bradyrhizobium sp. Ash2021]|uniref:ABC transporter substrate-binding protein n=1 Tax=Bradyrhizobium sp. Ash2021 TaxID=2954771 RepID=UPI0028153811|nr:ABC transporter substrate-binding protein [Bradyrhizobium sp. Ash2021]WMT76241.1 ABC transporter substrate-binding protein [Bradyrhizobium sp. Ash2021]